MKLFLPLLLIAFISQTTCKLHIINSEQYFTIRNSILRKLIHDDVYKAKLIIKSTKFFYNKLLSKYYEINEKYYCLTEEERNIIETIISLAY